MKGLVRRLGSFATIAAIAVGACKGPAGPALQGSWSGFLYLYDEFGAPLANDSGVTVKLLPPGDTSVTGPAGAYSFTTINVGVYSLGYAGQGIGPTIQGPQQFVGGGTINIPGLNLSKQSTGVVTGFAVRANATGDTLFATGTIQAPPVGVSRYVRLFYTSTTASPSATTWTVTGPTAFGAFPYAVSTAAFTIAVTGQDLLALKSAFASGTKVNAVAYGDSYFENSYTDVQTGKPIFPNVSNTKSNLTTFVMP